MEMVKIIFFHFSSYLFTIAERLDISEALNFANADGDDENDHIDDSMLFFGCITTDMTHDLFPILWLWTTSDHCLLFILFPMNTAHGLR